MKCPNCGSSELYATDSLYCEYYGDSYHDNVTGTCPDCGKSYQWVEVFNFDHYEDVVEL